MFVVLTKEDVISVLWTGIQGQHTQNAQNRYNSYTLPPHRFIAKAFWKIPGKTMLWFIKADPHEKELSLSNMAFYIKT